MDRPSESIPVAVTRAVADAKAVEPTALEPLDTVVPSDALADLHAEAETDVVVTFEYADHPVSVRNGVVRVYPDAVSLIG